IKQDPGAAGWAPSSTPGSGVGPPRISAACLHPILAMGASTGGPEALACILRALPAGFPAGVVVIQHIAAEFAPSLGKWPQGQPSLPGGVGCDGDELRPGNAFLAGTNDHMVMRADHRLGYAADPVGCPYRPSVDVFFNSLAAAWPRPGIAVLLTGMGSDGARGLLQLRRLGWHTIKQDEDGCGGYGMPLAAAGTPAAAQGVPLSPSPVPVRGQVRPTR